MLNKRLASAAVIVSGMLLLIWLDFHWGRADVWHLPGLVLGSLSIVIITIASGELASMWRSTGQPVDVALVVVLTVWMGLGSCLSLGWPTAAAWLGGAFASWSVAMLVAVMVGFAGEMTRLGSITGQADRLARTVMILVYLSLPVVFMALHRTWSGDNGLGLSAFLAVVVSVKFSDVGAYFVGKTWGRHKMSPRLSPNKTVEGAVGGFVGGIAGSALVWWLVAPWLLTDRVDVCWGFVLAYGAVIAAAGMFGDLAESLLKRDLHTKDSSVWLPGLGGVMDIIDSLVFALPASYLFLLVWPPA